MSIRAIHSALRKKGIEAESVQLIRGATGNGWLIELTEDSEQALLDAGFSGDFDPDCAAADSVIAWIEALPNCNPKL